MERSVLIDSLATISPEKKQSRAESKNDEEMTKKMKGSYKRRKRKKKKKEKEYGVSREENGIEGVGKIGGEVESDPSGLVCLAGAAILDANSRTVEAMKKMMNMMWKRRQ